MTLKWLDNLIYKDLWSRSLRVCLNQNENSKTLRYKYHHKLSYSIYHSKIHTRAVTYNQIRNYISMKGYSHILSIMNDILVYNVFAEKCDTNASIPSKIPNIMTVITYYKYLLLLLLWTIYKLFRCRGSSTIRNGCANIHIVDYCHFIVFYHQENSIKLGKNTLLLNKNDIKNEKMKNGLSLDYHHCLYIDTSPLLPICSSRTTRTHTFLLRYERLYRDVSNYAFPRNNRMIPSDSICPIFGQWHQKGWAKKVWSIRWFPNFFILFNISDENE